MLRANFATFVCDLDETAMSAIAPGRLSSITVYQRGRAIGKGNNALGVGKRQMSEPPTPRTS